MMQYVSSQSVDPDQMKSNGISKENSSKGTRTRPLKQISAEEFDARFDAGEDMSDYLDWENAVVVQPGEMSPAQKLSIIEEIIENLQMTPGAQKHLSPRRKELSVSLSSLALAEVDCQAARRRMSREELVRSWIEEKLVEQKATK